MNIQEISALISVRHYADRVIDNSRVKLSKEDVNNLERQIVAFDNKIVKEILVLSLKEEEKKTKMEETPKKTEEAAENARRSFAPKK